MARHSSISLFLVLCVLVVACNATSIFEFRNPAETLLEINSYSDFFVASILITLGYVATYFGLASVLEYTHPAPKNDKRINSIKKEITLGVWALIADVAFALFWLACIDKYTPFYGWYNTHEFTPLVCILNIFVYLFVFDTWFYWTHRSLHHPWMWKKIHNVHHQFVHPTAFGQDAVHPFEAVYQGPMGHYAVSLLFPMHPVVMAVMGLGTSIWAICAHDGRAGDLNSHTRHHTHKHVNFGLYWGFWDWVCGTRYQEKKTPTYTAVKELKGEDLMKTY
jgi:lathosterol oxidase